MSSFRSTRRLATLPLSSVCLLMLAVIGWSIGQPSLAWADSTVTLQIAASADDVNEDNGSLDSSSSILWLGNGASTTTSYTGLRFTAIAIPAGATITTAVLQVYSAQSQWISYSFTMAGDAAGNSAAFTSSARPSQRPLTTAIVNHSDNVNWAANTWYALEDLKGVIQELVNRADWQSGNSLSIVIKGTGNAYGRKFVRSYDGSAANAPKLTITYASGALPAPTATLTSAPSTITSGQSSTLSWNTTNATTVSIDQGVGTVAASGSTSVSPTATTTYTLTATNSTGTATSSTTVTVNPLPVPTATLGVSPTSITSGSSATLSWTTTNAGSVTIDQGIGPVAASGSLQVSPTATTTYHITATNSSGTATGSATLTVTQPAPTVTFTASPMQIASGQSSTLSWTTSGATSVSIDQGIGTVAASGTQTVSPVATTTYTITATNGTGSTARSVTVTVVGSSGTLTQQIGSSGDDVNEASGTLTTDAGTLWLGTGASSASSYAGLRFNNVTIPAGATITSAVLQVYSAQGQWIGLSFSMAADATGNSAAFTTGARPSQRALTTSKVAHNDNVNWTANAWYTLDDIKSVIQEIVNRADWQSGNSLSIIVTGTGGAYARKFVNAFDGTAANAPKLVIAYTGATPPPPPVPTATISVSPTSIIAGSSATLSWSTTNATSISINQGIGPVAASGSKTVAPTVTTAYTVTASNSSGTATQSATLTVSGAPSQTSFAVNAGFSDVVPHQIVRSGADVLYLFAATAPFSSTIGASWASGLPSAGSSFSGSAQVTLAANPISVSPAYDGATTIHVVANLQNGSIVDVPFDLSSNSFRPAKTLATTSATVSGDYEGSSGLTSMVDLTGNLHVAYWAAGDQIVHVAFTYDPSSDVLSLASAPVRIDTAGSARHPSLAVSPTDNSVTVAWVSLATTPKQILARVRDASGTWSAVQIVSDPATDVWTSTSGGIDVDQGPSLLITADGTKHLAYIQNYDTTGNYGSVHYVSNAGSGWVDRALIATYTHDPALATNAAGDLYIIGHGHPSDASAACQNQADMCLRKKNADGTWTSSTLFAQHTGSNSFDSSPSVKWSVVGWNRPEAIEFLFFQTPYAASTLFYGRIQ